MECKGELPRLEPPYCRLCSDPGPRTLYEWCHSTSQPFDGITAPYKWAGTVPEIVYSFKYHGIRASMPRLAAQMADHLSAPSIEVDLVVPVPLYPTRERERGYNHSVLFAKGVV